jgi:hypothetical protein
VDDAGRLRIGLLGACTAASGDTPLDLGGPRQRAVLVVLVLARDEVHGLAAGGRGKQIQMAVAVHVAEADCVEPEVLERGQAGDRA